MKIKNETLIPTVSHHKDVIAALLGKKNNGWPYDHRMMVTLLSATILTTNNFFVPFTPSYDDIMAHKYQHNRLDMKIISDQKYLHSLNILLFL